MSGFMPHRRRRTGQRPPCEACSFERACMDAGECLRDPDGFGIERLTGQLFEVEGGLQSAIVGFDHADRVIYSTVLGART